VIWAGRDPMILERVEYYPAPAALPYNKNPFEDVFKETYDEF